MKQLLYLDTNLVNSINEQEEKGLPDAFAAGQEIKDRADSENYVEIIRNFNFVDFEYLEGLFSKDGIIDLFKKLDKERDEQYDEIHSIISGISKIIPYGKLLVSDDGYLIPTDDKYYHINLSGLGFMCGGEMQVFGIVTNIIGNDSDTANQTNIFSTLQYSVNEVLRQILPTKEEKLYVVSPIAIYSEII